MVETEKLRKPKDKEGGKNNAKKFFSQAHMVLRSKKISQNHALT